MEMTTQPFAWNETEARLTELWREHRLTFDAKRSIFVAEGIEFVPPPCFPIAGESQHDPARYLERLPQRLRRMAIVLVHAGATALGLYDDDTLLAHKVIKKYVVRGNGKAQVLHLKTKGKSRYGSRLRLQNFESQLADTNAKLREWWAEFGAFDRVFRHCPERIAPELDAASSGPPWPRAFRVESIPFHVHVPDFAELKRVRWKLVHGEIRRSLLV